MELRQITCFVAVAEEQSFRRASERIGIAQPTVTLLIQRLEREVGSPLFDRSTRPVSLTPTGHRMLNRARNVLAAAREALDSARRHAPGIARELRLGAPEGGGPRLESLLQYILNKVPEMHIELSEGPDGKRLEQVRNGELDATFVRIDQEFTGLSYSPVWDEELVIALPLGHPLTSRQALRLEELKDLPLRLVERSANPMSYDFVVRSCRDAGFDPLLGKPFRTTQNTVAEIGVGPPSWAVVCGSTADHRSRLVAYRPVAPPLSVTTYLAVRDTEADSETTRLLLDAALESSTRD
jgi:DNA-binding transcriptional LysR family regulator